MMNKKGIVSEFGEMVLGIIFYTVLLLVVLFFVGSIAFRVNATVYSDNSAFTCNNNLITMLQFDSGGEKTFSDLLLEGLSSPNALDLFKGRARTLLDSVAIEKKDGKAKWRLDAYYSGENLFKDSGGRLGIVGAGGDPNLTNEDVPPEKRNAEACEAYLPVPCDGEDCVIRMKLVMAYA